MKVIVVGGGPGGYVAALKAAILGAETVLIEMGDVGGTCLNQGCIPTKSFLQSTGCMEEIFNAEKFGIRCNDIQMDYSTVLKRKNKLVKQLASGVEFLLKTRGVRIVRGEGKVIGGKAVEVINDDGSFEIIKGDAVILATGSYPVIYEAFRYDGSEIITSDEALNLEELPKSIIIIGGGVIGCEFGQFFKKMGCDVTIVELADRVLPMEDKDASVLLEKVLKKNGVKIITGTKVNDVKKLDKKVSVILSNGECLEAEKLLVSIGRKARIEKLNLEKVGVEIQNGKIVVNKKMQTSVEGYYAIGDIVNTPALAHVASREALVAVDNIMGRNSVITYNAVPRCVYTEPEIACVGMTEEEAKAKGIDYKIGKFNLAGLGKAVVMNQTDGFVKVIADKDGRLIGAVMVGPHVTDIVSELTVAIHLGLDAEQLGEVIHPHPTIAEAVLEALHDVKGEAVHSF